MKSNAAFKKLVLVLVFVFCCAVSLTAVVHHNRIDNTTTPPVTSLSTTPTATTMLPTQRLATLHPFDPNNLSLIDPIDPMNLEGTSNYTTRNPHAYTFDRLVPISLVEPIDNIVVLDWKMMYQQLFNALSQGTLNIEGSDNQVEDCIEPIEGEYNVVFLVYDEINPEEERKEYIKVYVDRRQVGITNQAFRSEFKFYKTWLEPGRYILNLEKWSYNDITNRWIRQPNMFQPEARYFEVNQEIVTVVEVVYFGDTQSYEYYSSCMTESDIDLFEMD